MKSILLSVLVIASAALHAKPVTTVKEDLKFICQPGDPRDVPQTFTLLETTVTDSASQSTISHDLTVKLDDCGTLPDTDERKCIKMAGLFYSTWSGDMSVTGYSGVYNLEGYAFSDAIDPKARTTTELPFYLTVAVGVKPEDTKFFYIHQVLNVATKQVTTDVTDILNCKLL